MLSTKKLLRQLPSEDVSWQVAPPRSTQRTVGNNPTVWHGFDRGGDGLAASLAPNGEVAEPGLGQVPHGNSIGELKAKVIHKPSSQLRATLRLSWCQSGYGTIVSLSYVFAMFFPAGYTGLTTLSAPILGNNSPKPFGCHSYVFVRQQSPKCPPLRLERENPKTAKPCK